MSMKRIYLYFVLFVVPFSAYSEETQEPHPLSTLSWQVGPAVGEIDARARIQVPEGYAFLDSTDTDRYLELTENFPTGKDHLFTPVSLSWSAYFSFDPVGYVKDDEELDVDEIFQTIKDGTEAANAERRKRGWAEMHIKGWHTQPHYDDETNRLEWALLAVSGDQEIVNYNTRFLGRKGVMEVTLVASPEELSSAISKFNGLAEGFSFNEGERYAEYRDGDKLATYGLAALVAGGAAAVAAKGGAKFGKAIIFAVIAGFGVLWAGAKRFFRRG